MKKLRFKYITPFVNEDFFKAVKKGMNDAANMLGVDAEFTGTDDADCVRLTQLIDEAVAQKVDGLAVSFIDPKLNDAVKRAALAGVPVVAFNVGAFKDSHALSSVCQNVFEAGVKVGKLAASNMPPDAKAIITLHDDVEVLHERRKGIESVLGDRIAQSLVTGNTPELAASAIRKALCDDRRIAAVIGTGQSDTHGAAIVAKELSDETKLYVAGFDVCAEILHLIKEGIVDFTIDQQPYVQGFYPLLQLYQNVKYHLMPANIDAGHTAINQENVEVVIELSKNGYR